MTHRNAQEGILRALAWSALLAAVAACPSCKRSAGPARVRIRSAEWRVELATTEAARRRGLSGRRELPAGSGMLFVYDHTGHAFAHMKDCYIPLDIAFISEKLRIVNIRNMIVEPDPQNPQITYPSEGPVRYSLEVPGGDFERAGVKVGDRVELLGAARDAIKAAR